MKKRLALLLALTMLLTAAGCVSDTPAPVETPTQTTPPAQVTETPAPETPAPSAPVELEQLSITLETEYEMEWKEANPLCQVSYPEFSLSEADEDRYPALDEALEGWAEEMELWAERFFDIYSEAGRNAYADGTLLTGWRGGAELLLRRADSRAVSLLFPLTVSENDGTGAQWFKAANLDTETGKEIKLGEVIFGFDKLPGLLEAQLKEQYPEVEFYPVADILQDYLDSDPTGGSFVWTLDPQGVTFHFGSGELSASRTHSVTLLYSQHPDLFQDTYTQSIDSYILSGSADSPIFADLNDDGIQERIEAFGVMDDYGMILNVGVSVNGTEVLAECYGYALDPYLVHTADGRDYLYLDCSQDNDYHAIAVFDLNGDVPVYVDTFWNASFLRAEWEDNPAEIPTDPSAMLMVSRMDALSTYNGWQTWSVGENGMPAPVEGYFTAVTPLTLTSKVVLTAQVLTKTGTLSGETTELPASTRMTILRTDNESFVDFRLEDGQQVRLDIQLDGWPYQVNGMDVDACFDGLMYAG